MTKYLGKVRNMRIYRHEQRERVAGYTVKIAGIVISQNRPFSSYGPAYQEAIARVAHNKR